MSGRHPYQRIFFPGIVVTCWVVGLFGLDRSRMSSFQLPIVVAAGFIGYWLVGALRRRLEPPADGAAHEIHEPQTCVVVKRLGEAGRTIRPAVPVEQSVVAPTNRARPTTRKRNYIPLSG